MTTKQIGRSSCTSILIGKNATADGSVIIGRNEDSRTAWPKHLQFNTRTTQKNAIFKSKDNKFQMALPEVAFQYSATPEWTDRYGVFAEDGINEYHVAVSATESAYGNAQVLAYDPFELETGILEEAIVTVVLPYVKTAREGVQLLGQIINEHGSAEGNGILFGDQKEAWYFEVASGHQWVAQRIPDDSYAVVANQIAIETVDFTDPDHFLTSPNLREFVAENRLWPENQTFNFRRIFGTADDSDLVYNTPRVWSGQRLLTPSVQQDPEDFNLPFTQMPDFPITIKDAARVLSDHYQNTPYDLVAHPDAVKRYRPISVATTQESHLLQLRNVEATNLVGLHWLAMGVSAQSVYVPFYSAGSKVPPMYTRGKETYTTNSAYWVFKQASVLLDRNWNRYARQLTNTQTKVNQILAQQIVSTDQLIHTTTAAEQLTVLDEANQKAAATAIKAYQKLIEDLITDQTLRSPLNFKVDPNL
ncbi:C69 family dipeptidase [Lapidilactobacillus bayanensis]|uniref:C69 family dipeptidase n=1 Tax=Lapidilactobacillus bayanensis TaxID=2485998 RepID=UPI000F76E3EA|nr:C69 family dipeptidase [Lapidilactobacillus bayanensis]